MPIVFEQVSFSYDGKRNALSNVDFTLEDGDFLGIIGHTGSGKSTITQLMNALLIPTSGRVLVDRVDTAQKKQRRLLRQRVGLAFQYPESQLFAQTVADDIAFGPRNQGLNEEEVQRRVHKALARVGFAYEDLAQRSPFDLSGGQQRRVALAGILACEPSVLVLDEPAAGMDPATIHEIRDYLRELNKEGLTIVLVSHSMEEIAELCSRVIVLQEGEIYIQGSPAEVFTKDNAKELRRINLGVPRATKFALELASKGLELPGVILNETQLANALIELQRRDGAHG